MNNAVCIDTQIMIWGIKEQSSPSQQDMINRAKNFLQHLDKTGKTIILPSLVVAELLVPIEPDMHQMVINLITQHYVVAPFDTKASSIFARILKSKMNDGTAIAQNAECIYSYDTNDIVRFADGYIPVLEMPTILNQLPLPTPE